MARLKTVGKWVLQVLLGAMFVALGIAKFMSPEWERRFAHWGFPPGFQLVIGTFEAAGGLCLLLPALTSYAALGLMAIMAGAVLTHLVHGETRSVTRPMPLLVLLGLLAWARWSSARRHARAPRTEPLGDGATRPDPVGGISATV